jgi:hypothetical protein
LRLLDVELDFLVVKQTFAQTLAERLARRAAFVCGVGGAESDRPRARQQNVENPVFCLIFSLLR